MTQINYVKTAKDFVLKVIKHRNFLSKNHLGFVPETAKTEIPNIKNALPRISNSTNMKDYLLRKETSIRFLIPKNKKTWQNEFSNLLQTNINE